MLVTKLFTKVQDCKGIKMREIVKINHASFRGIIMQALKTRLPAAERNKHTDKRLSENNQEMK